MSAAINVIPIDPLIGQTLAGRYEIVERIGNGGMGAVYHAIQYPLGRTVAIKILREDVIRDENAISRFHREAKATSLLRHPNTVRIFDFGETPEGLLFLVMEFLEGETLTERMEKDERLEPIIAVNIIRAVLASLHEAHSMGIVHRDLKPDNIVLTRVEGHTEPVVKVLDFGIAKIVRGDAAGFDQLETQAGTVFGTPRYMSPEQARGHQLDARSDIYAVGVLLYELLAGVPPFAGDDAVVVMAKHVQENAVRVRRAVDDGSIPRSLDRTVMRALTKKRDERYQSADEMIAALENALFDLDALAGRSASGLHRLGTSQMIPGESQQNRWIMLVAFAAIFVMIGAAVPFLLDQNGAESGEDSAADSTQVGVAEKLTAIPTTQLNAEKNGENHADEAGETADDHVDMAFVEIPRGETLPSESDLGATKGAVAAKTKATSVKSRAKRPKRRFKKRAKPKKKNTAATPVTYERW